MEIKAIMAAMLAAACAWAHAMPTNEEIAKADAEVQARLKDQLAKWQSGEMSDADMAKFRTFLSTLVRHLLANRYRAEKARGADRRADEESADSVADGDDPGSVIDAKWIVACRMAAEARVMEGFALGATGREVWRLVSVEGMKVKDAAKRLGIPANTASKTKRRIEAMIAAMVKMYSE